MNEFGVPDHGTALQDDELNSMYESYQVNTSKYYVVISDGDIKGGAGISKLKGSNENICELQKMYFLQDIRGKGIGSKLIKMCLDFAKKSGYKFCYIETMHNMIAAQNLYKKNGFFLENYFSKHDVISVGGVTWRKLRLFSATKPQRT